MKTTRKVREPALIPKDIEGGPLSRLFVEGRLIDRLDLGPALHVTSLLQGFGEGDQDYERPHS